MEHFLRPAQVQHQPIEIPYLCTEEYDNGPFVSYPERLKFDRAVRAHHVWCIEASADDIDSFNAFLQNWLGFGLMSAVFGRLVRSEEFTRGMMGLDGQPRRVLDSTRLVGLSRELITRGQSLNLGQQNANDGALTPVFQSARTMLSQNLRGHSSKDVDHKLVLFLSLLYENLFVVAKLAFGVGRASQLVKPSIPSRQGSDYLIAQLKEDGWCPREVQFLISRFNGSFRYFAIQLDRPGIHRDHRQSTCTALGCRAYNVDESNYFTAHTSPGCECEHVSIDSRRLIAILEKEIVPVVRCVRGEDDALRLVLVEATPGVNYVAISHVWSDGMGNPRANSMPACQIEHMHTLASVRFGEPVPFWIDTLCCPVEPEEATDRAIFLMRQTYADASHVIVVDSWLYRQESATLSDTERMARIALSAWTRRLWTFQEGILAKELWFRFADNLIDVDLIGQAIMDSHDIRDAPLKSYLLEEYLRLRGIGMPLQWGMRERLPLLVDAMQFRSTSVPTDEALCLGALLDLDMSVILAHSNEERMKALWSLVSNIPSSLIFLDAPKLPQPGFRWAPATLFGLNDSGGTFGKIVHGKTGGVVAPDATRTRRPTRRIHVPLRRSWGRHRGTPHQPVRVPRRRWKRVLVRMYLARAEAPVG
jgi:hypothetical protein